MAPRLVLTKCENEPGWYLAHEDNGVPDWQTYGLPGPEGLGWITLSDGSLLRYNARGIIRANP